MFKERIREIIIVATVAVCSLIIFLTSSSIKKMDAEEIRLKRKYSKVVDLYHKVETSQRKRKRFEKDIIMLVSHLSKKLNLKGKIVSSSSFKTPEGSGIYMKVRRLTLNQLTDLLSEIESYSNLEILAFKLRHNMYRKQLLDADIKVLRRNLF